MQKRSSVVIGVNKLYKEFFKTVIFCTNIPKNKDLYQVQETLKKLCEFSSVWADRAGLGSQKSFSKMTSILPRKTHDNFQIDIQKITQIKKIWLSRF